MRAFGIAGLVMLTGCGVANHYPPTGLLDAPAVEFRNAEGLGRWCTSPDAPGALSAVNYRSCREGLLADGYQEIGPWCGGTPPTEGETAAIVALSAVTGGLLGAISAARLTDSQAAHHTACQRRAAAQ